MTTGGGYRYSTSVGGSLTGRGGNIVIVDDPIKPDDALSDAIRSTVNDWFDRTLYTRLDDKSEDVIILIMQRLHMEDLAGHVLAKGEPWVQLNLPAIAETQEHVAIGPDRFHVRKPGDLLHPEREPQSVLDGLESSLGNFSFSAQYQQRPVPVQGEVIKWSWFQFYEEPLTIEPGDVIVQSWDTACKAGDRNDYSVCTTWLARGDNYFLIDVVRERLTYPDLRQRIIESKRDWDAELVLIEDMSSGSLLIDDLCRDDEAGVYPMGVDPVGDKVLRMHSSSKAIEQGRVYLPIGAPWLDAFRAELLQFPKGRYDDQVDSLSQFLEWADRTGAGQASVVTFI